MKIDQHVLDIALSLKVISTPSVGTDHIDLSYCEEKHINVFSLENDDEVLSKVHSTAEFTFGVLLSMIKKIPWSFDSVKKGNWIPSRFRGYDLTGKKIGIVGFGRIGSRLAQYARSFDMKIFVHDPFVGGSPDWVERKSFIEIIRESNIISIHVPLTSKTKNLFNKSIFSEMDGVYLLNLSRGRVINELDLLCALKNGNVIAAALDVLSNEDLETVSSNPLIDYARNHDNLLITPHCAGSSIDGQQITFSHAAKKIRDFLMSYKRVVDHATA